MEKSNNNFLGIFVLAAGSLAISLASRMGKK
jgi:hypothetical protein